MVALNTVRYRNSQQGSHAVVGLPKRLISICSSASQKQSDYDILSFCGRLQFNTKVTRGHMYKLYKPSSTSSARSRFFACRIINAWNNLALSTDFSSVNAFKRSISKTDFSEYLKYDV